MICSTYENFGPDLLSWISPAVKGANCTFIPGVLVNLSIFKEYTGALKSSCPPGKGAANIYNHGVTKPCLACQLSGLPPDNAGLRVAVWTQEKLDPNSSGNWNSMRSGASPELCMGREASEACCAEITAKQAGAVGLEVSHREPERWWRVFGLLFGGLLYLHGGEWGLGEKISFARAAVVEVQWWAQSGLWGGLVRVKMLGHAQQDCKQQDECMHESACMSHVHRHSAVVTQPTAWLAEPLKRNHTRTNILCACLIHKAWAKRLAHTVLKCTLLIPLVPRKCYWLQMVTGRIAQSSPYV